MKKKKEKQSEATKFLERNKIWFTAVIPTFISIGVAGAGMLHAKLILNRLN